MFLAKHVVLPFSIFADFSEAVLEGTTPEVPPKSKTKIKNIGKANFR
jgi:hypothetical protein